QTEVVAAALGEDFVSARVRMIAPDHAALVIDAGRLTWVGARTADAARGGAALDAVDPAIRPPGETVGDRVRIFETEAGQAHFGAAVGHVITVGIRVEEQVGRV